MTKKARHNRAAQRGGGRFIVMASRHGRAVDSRAVHTLDAAVSMARTLRNRNGCRCGVELILGGAAQPGDVVRWKLEHDQWSPTHTCGPDGQAVPVWPRHDGDAVAATESERPKARKKPVNNSEAAPPCQRAC